MGRKCAKTWVSKKGCMDDTLELYTKLTLSGDVGGIECGGWEAAFGLRTKQERSGAKLRLWWRLCALVWPL
jgi:hypothetical protein